MKGRLVIDAETSTVEVHGPGGMETYPFASQEAFTAVSDAWLRLGWDCKHVYTFTWMGRPIIQLPEDIVRIQEVMYTLAPDVIVETGIAHGGSLTLYASLCKAMGKGRIIGVDIEIRPHNRAALEEHELREYFTLIEGSSVDPEVVQSVAAMIQPGERVLVLLDSNHSRSHVLAELEAYAPLVTPGSYIVACDGIMADVIGAPRTAPEWNWDNPREAVGEFLAANADFELAPPPFQFNESSLERAVSYWDGGWLRRRV